MTSEDELAILVAKHKFIIDHLRACKLTIIWLRDKTSLPRANRSFDITIDKIDESMMWAEKACLELITL